MPPIVTALVEKVKQQLNVGEPGFRPLSTVPNEQMLAEAEDFSRVLVAYRAGVVKYALRLNQFLQTHDIIMENNLPRIWEAVQRGQPQCEPIRQQLSMDHPTRIGGDWDHVKFEESRQVMQRRLLGIIRGLDRWLARLDAAKARMAKLKAEGLVVDAKRRSITRESKAVLTTIAQNERWAMEHKEEEPLEEGEESADASHTVTSAAAAARSETTGGRAVGGGRGSGGGGVLGATGGPEVPGGGSSTAGEHLPLSTRSTTRSVPTPSVTYSAMQHDEKEVRREDLARHAMYQQRKLEAVTASYQEQENMLHEHLASLNRDAAWFKSSVASTLLIIKEAMQADLFAFGPCKQPLPGYSVDRCGLGGGEIGTLDKLAEDVPEAVKAALAAPAEQPAAPVAVAVAIVPTPERHEAAPELRTPDLGPSARSPEVHTPPNVPLDGGEATASTRKDLFSEAAPEGPLAETPESKRKGMSADDKRDTMLSIFHSSRDVYVLKDIEKMAVKKGIVSQSVKDVLQSLVDDDLVRQEKIGISNYYWSFPSEASVKLESELAKLQTDLESVKKQRVDTRAQIVTAKKGKENTEGRTAAMAELDKLKAQDEECSAELAKYKDNDPEAYKLMLQGAEAARQAANRWTDNIDSLYSWCKRRFEGKGTELAELFKEVGAVDLEPL